jgi:hypothetical protein
VELHLAVAWHVDHPLATLSTLDGKSEHQSTKKQNCVNNAACFLRTAGITA